MCSVVSTRRTKVKPKASGTLGNVATSALFERSLQHRIAGGPEPPDWDVNLLTGLLIQERRHLSLRREQIFFFSTLLLDQRTLLAERVTYMSEGTRGKTKLRQASPFLCHGCQHIFSKYFSALTRYWGMFSFVFCPATASITQRVALWSKPFGGQSTPGIWNISLKSVHNTLI